MTAPKLVQGFTELSHYSRLPDAKFDIMNTDSTNTDTPRTAYAAKLSAILAELHMPTDEVIEFGKELAEAQTPPRAIPYHDFTIAGWAKDELLPTPQAQQALVKLLADEYSVPKATLQSLKELHATALTWQAEQENQPSELSHAMKHALTLSGKSQDDLARAFVAQNTRWNEARAPNADRNKIAKLGATKGNISFTLMGSAENAPSKLFTYTIELICKPPFSLRAIYENSLRERADQLWVAAEKEGDLGGLIKACRVRLGEGMKTFATRIGNLAGKDGFGSSATCLFWENNSNLPQGDKHQTAQTLYKPMVRAMKLADTAKNGLSLSIEAPWFDAAKEDAFRQVFTQAVTKANEGMFTSELPSPTAVECPDPKTVPEHLRIYGGKLDRRLVNGKQLRE